MCPIDSSLEESMKEQVLTMTTSAFVGLGDHLHPGLVEVADHDLAVDEILGAAERDEADLDQATFFFAAAFLRFR